MKPSVFLAPRRLRKKLGHFLLSLHLRVRTPLWRIQLIESRHSQGYSDYKRQLFHSWLEGYRRAWQRRLWEERKKLLPHAILRVAGESEAFPGVPDHCPVCHAPRMERSLPTLVGRHGDFCDHNGHAIGLLGWHVLCRRCHQVSEEGYALPGDFQRDLRHFLHNAGRIRGPDEEQGPHIIRRHFLTFTQDEGDDYWTVWNYSEDFDTLAGTTSNPWTQAIVRGIGAGSKPSRWAERDLGKTECRDVEDYLADRALCFPCGRLCKDHPVETAIHDPRGGSSYHRLCDGTIAQVHEDRRQHAARLLEEADDRLVDEDTP